MPHSRDVALYLAAAITGIAAAYVLNEWVLYLWEAPPDNPDQPVHDSESPPLPPPHVPDTTFGTHADDEQEPSDTGSLVEVLSPPARGLARRRSMMRAHDLFAASHISFTELGSLVAPSDEEQLSDTEHDEH